MHSYTKVDDDDALSHISKRFWLNTENGTLSLTEQHECESVTDKQEDGWL
jgi:hypothetical protein